MCLPNFMKFRLYVFKTSRMDGLTDGQRENSILPHKHSLRGYNKVDTSYTVTVDAHICCGCTSHIQNTYPQFQMSLVTRKPVSGISDQVRLKPACSAKKASYSLEIVHVASIGIILSRQQTTKALIRLRCCADWSAPLLFAFGKNRFSHDVTHIKVCSLVFICL